MHDVRYHYLQYYLSSVAVGTMHVRAGVFCQARPLLRNNCFERFTIPSASVATEEPPL